MKLIELAQQFYKLASNRPKMVDFFSVEAYQKELKQLRDKFAAGFIGTFMLDIVDFIAKWQMNKAFNMQDLMPMFDQYFNQAHHPTSIISYIGYATDKHVLPILIDATDADFDKGISLWLKTEQDLGSGNYLKMEKIKKHLKPETLQLAQRKVILHLVRLFRQEEPEEGITDEKLDALKEWRVLYNNSTTIPRKFLEELAKKFGVDFHTQALVGNGVGGRMEEKLNKLWTQKLHLDTYDIDLIIWNWGGVGIDKDKMLNLIERADESGKERLRQFIYYPYTMSLNPSGAYFILGGDMQPIGIDYRSLPWPDRISANTVKIIPAHERQKWIDLFNDFGIIPV